MDVFDSGGHKLELVTFHWSVEHGRCEDCGLPAAFRTLGRLVIKLCAICAANHAADGETIERVAP